MSSLQPYELYAIRYAHHERRASENFIGGDPHDVSMPLDYYIWVIKNAQRLFVLDTGFDLDIAEKRKRQIVRHPAEGLKAIGIDPADVEDVIISHMHYDHCGNHTLFPKARYHLQESEMQYCTGRYMCHGVMRFPFEADDVVAMVRRLYAGKVEFHNGTAELAPGVGLHHIGGHTMGLQAARVWTKRGWVVLASDASHLYANMDQGRPFPVVFNVGDMLEGHKKLRSLADSPNHVVPGHDPLVLKRYPAAAPALAGSIVRLDEEPRA